MKIITSLSFYSCIFIFHFTCSGKPAEQPSFPLTERTLHASHLPEIIIPSPRPAITPEEWASQPRRVSKFIVSVKKDDLEFIAKLTDALNGGNSEAIHSELEVFKKKSSEGGFHMGFTVNTIMQKGNAEHRALADDLICALCRVAESSEATELNQAVRTAIGGTTGIIFEAAGANGPGGIPPAKHVLEWWQASKVRPLLLGK